MTSNYFDKLDKELITDKKKIITETGTYSLFLSEIQNSVDLFFGGIKKGCLNISINLNSDTAIIDSLIYDSKCNLQSDLEEGSGTKNMISTVFSYIKQNYPQITYGKLIDTSFKTCKYRLPDLTYPSMNLGLTYLMLNKKTWYESFLGAVIEDKHIKKEYDEFVSTIETIRITLTFEQFYIKYFRQFSLNLNFNPLFYLDTKYSLNLPDLYSNHKYYYTLFKEVRQKIKDDTDSCLFFSTFIYKFMIDISNSNILKFTGTYWKFPLNNTKEIHFTLESYNIQLGSGISYYFNNGNFYSGFFSGSSSLALA
jgi:hypothetical protein